MAAHEHEIGQLRQAIINALAIADSKPHHIIAALLAQCLDEIDRLRPDSI